MTTNLNLVLENHPGTLGDVTEALGRAAVNIEGLCCFASQGIAILHIAVEHADAARRAVEHIGLKVYEERPVEVIQVEDRPGAAGQVFRKLGRAGVNVDLAYLASGTRLVIGADDIDTLRAVV
jgi:hypothetical protein